MTEKYDLQSLIENPDLFDQRVNEYAIEMLDTLDINEAQLVYRYNDREIKEGWIVGTIVDAVNECMDRRDL